MAASYWPDPFEPFALIMARTARHIKSVVKGLRMEAKMCLLACDVESRSFIKWKCAQIDCFEIISQHFDRFSMLWGLILFPFHYVIRSRNTHIIGSLTINVFLQAGFNIADTVSGSGIGYRATLSRNVAPVAELIHSPFTKDYPCLILSPFYGKSELFSTNSFISK